MAIMVGAHVARRVVISRLLLLTLAVSGVGWADESPGMRAADSAVSGTRPPGLTIDAALSGRSDVLTGTWAEQRGPKARVRLGLAVLVGFSMLLPAAIVTLRRPSPAPTSTSLGRRWSAARRAPPDLRIA